MPVQNCSLEGKPGFKWGQEGTCYIYEPGDAKGRAEAKERASLQGRAIEGDSQTTGATSTVPTDQQATAESTAERLKKKYRRMLPIRSS